jgi:putative tryptophan/tyrosine transport system permease protein
MLNFWISILEQGLIFGIMVLGVYITYKILDFPDLSVDGSFPLGAAVTASALVLGVSPAIACFLSLLSGLIAGSVTGFLHVKLKITNLLSGILVMIALYSINLRIMGKANIPLFNKDTVFSGKIHPIIVIALFVLAAKLLLDLFFRTKLGYLLKSTGDNPQLVTSLGVDTGWIKILGLALSNGLVALSGSIMAQHQRFSDVGMGSGIIVMGLASIIFGEAILKKFSFITATTIAIFGSILYKTCTAFALKLGFPPTDLKLITSIIVVMALALNYNKFNFKFRKMPILGGKSHVANTKSV